MFLTAFLFCTNLIPCRQVLDEPKLYNEARQCTEISYKKPIKLPLPKCYILPADCKLVSLTPYGNALNINEHTNILAWYTSKKQMIVIVENTREIMQFAYKHEAQHYFLDLLTGDGDGKHESLLWSRCIPAHYSKPN